MMMAFGGFLLGLLFFVELGAVLAFGYWGYHLETGWALRLAAVIGLPVAAAAFWGTFVAPKASIPVAPWLRATFQVAVFALAAVALYGAGRPQWAFLFGLIALIDLGLVYALKL